MWTFLHWPNLMSAPGKGNLRNRLPVQPAGLPKRVRAREGNFL